MLVEEEGASWPQNAPHLSDHLIGVADHAQHLRRDRGVEADVRHREALAHLSDDGGVLPVAKKVDFSHYSLSGTPPGVGVLR